MEEQRFDELTRLVATKTSRRQVLKVLVASTVGCFFLWEGDGRALASNSACAHFCSTVFGENTLAQSQCAMEGAHGKGLCYSACGPNHPAGTSGALCGTQSGGYYTGYAGTTCCAAGSATPACVSGVCAAICISPLQTLCNSSTDTCCDTGQGKTVCGTNCNPCGNSVCCQLPGGSCTNGYDCCGSEVCSNGTCMCTQDGDLCYGNEECCSGICSGGVCF